MNIKLDKRLSAVVSLLNGGHSLLDIGTDHAFLPVFCVQNGLFEFATVSDINEGPLENARQTISSFRLNERIETVLSDGFKSIEKTDFDEIVIAGMGGILISEILSEATWIKSRDVHLVLQPMTHAEDARKFLIENGFEIEKEIACIDGERVYIVISARFSGRLIQREKAYLYYGELPKNIDPASEAFLKKTFNSLQKKLSGLSLSDGNDEKIAFLKDVLNDFINNTGVNYDYQ